MISTRLQQQLDFLVEIDKLKTVLRQTSVITQSQQRENDAEHSWHLAMLIVVLREYASESIDLIRCIKMVLIHDLVEIDAGDTFAYDSQGYSDKEQREQAAADRIFNLLPSDQAKELRVLWDEFETGQTPEAKFAVAVDRLQPFLSNMQTQGGTWKKHHINSEQVLQRMAPIKAVSSELWQVILDNLEIACDKGYVLSPVMS